MPWFSFKWLLLLGVVGLWLWGAVGVDGPWRAQIVDAETGKPLEGVVVLTWWTKYYRSVGGWAGGKYYASEEVVTGPDGRFTILRRWTFTPSPGWSSIQGPEWIIYKPGYGRFQFRDMKGWEEKDSFERQARAEDIRHRFSRGEEFIFELPPLKTREERLKYYDQMTTPGSDVPEDDRTRFNEAEARERRFFGFRR